MHSRCTLCTLCTLSGGGLCICCFLLLTARPCGCLDGQQRWADKAVRCDVLRLLSKECAHKMMYLMQKIVVCTNYNNFVNMCTLFILCTLCTPTARCAHHVHTVHTGCSASQLMRRAEFLVFFYSPAMHLNSSTLCSRKILKVCLK